ncbi:BTB/POZ and TAZ domain-containing protein 1-like [Papaver somniferum]|uniref:BTB/POZ and TAZ domain-containing protein 1-like n=1 Tax=Papaver somniferum TaxID=3469 RepID=UPI000E6FC462|nr:BTB/POZ and TAZ domain-containing protein 1-like [Papaver somniferum]
MHLRINHVEEPLPEDEQVRHPTEEEANVEALAAANDVELEDTVEDVAFRSVHLISEDDESVLQGSSSKVLEKILDQPSGKHHNSVRVIPILGVPCDAVIAFVQFLYSSRCTEEEIDNYGIHLLALSHVFDVQKLKQRCTKGLSTRLMVENVVDVLQLARLCDAPDLYLKCMRFLSKEFKAVKRTEGWKFLRANDAVLELEILQFLDEIESRNKKRSRSKEEQAIYLELSEAMECLKHICTEGCTNVGLYDRELPPTKKTGACEKYSTCQGLQGLIKHFAMCKKRMNGGCCRCKRMGQLLKLHASICDQDDHCCKVPFCRQFKLKNQLERKADDGRWRLLVKKVVCAKTVSSLSSPKLMILRRKEEDRQQR